MAIHPLIKIELGFSQDADDSLVNAEWERRINSVCKPCWELKYCPYGSLAEQYPKPPLTMKEALAQQDYLKKCLESGCNGSGQPLTEERRKFFEYMIKSFNPDEHPEHSSQFDREITCTRYGHFCPVFFVNEPFAETREMRKASGCIPFKVKMRVARRDGYKCHKCKKELWDEEIGFESIVPADRGRDLGEWNVRLVCFECGKG